MFHKIQLRVRTKLSVDARMLKTLTSHLRSHFIPCIVSANCIIYAISLSHTPNLSSMLKTDLLWTDKQQRLYSRDFVLCSNFSFTTFSLMFFPLFSKVFTNILKIYELPKIHNKIPNYTQTLVLTTITYQSNSLP